MKDQNTPAETPSDEPVNVPANEPENPIIDVTKFEPEMKPENEPTKPAASAKDSKQENSKPTKRDTNKGTPAKASNSDSAPKKDYTFLIMAVVGLALGILLIYLRNRNKQRAAENAQGIDAENIIELPHNEQSGAPFVDHANLFDNRSPFIDPDYAGH